MAAQPAANEWTYADLARFPDDGNRYEIVDGHLVVSPSPIIRHQLVVGRLQVLLAAWASENHGLAYPTVNVDLAENTHLEPDVVWTSNLDTSGLGFAETPELIIEVSSPSTKRYDRGIKRDRYARAGVREFWFVDMDREELQQTIVTGTSAAEPIIHPRGATVTTDLLPGLTVDLDALFRLPG